MCCRYLLCNLKLNFAILPSLVFVTMGMDTLSNQFIMSIFFWWFGCLIVAARALFSYLVAVTITRDRAANLDQYLSLTAHSNEGSFTCHTSLTWHLVYTVSSEGPVLTFLSEFRNRDMRIVRSLRRRSDHCATLATSMYIRVRNIKTISD
jgi:hypothetical protein